MEAQQLSVTPDVIQLHATEVKFGGFRGKLGLRLNSHVHSYAKISVQSLQVVDCTPTDGNIQI